MWDQIQTQFKEVQNHICSGLSKISEQDYKEDIWNYDEGSGGGITRIFEGKMIEKGGVNFSSVTGILNKKIAKKMRLAEQQKFQATGVSLVIHPSNPFAPTVHLNIRYFNCMVKQWFGGGIDLTPYYPFEEDIVHFHSKLKEVCDNHPHIHYEKFKKWCDEYFYIPHRKEARGVGGIFFDNLFDDAEKTASFVLDLGRTFNQIYLPILKKRSKIEYNEMEREFQSYRRGRYVEFNLVYDRGTLFGLETLGRVESILMSLPPNVSWKYNWKPEVGSKEEKIYKLLTPRDWAKK